MNSPKSSAIKAAIGKHMIHFEITNDHHEGPNTMAHPTLDQLELASLQERIHSSEARLNAFKSRQELIRHLIKAAPPESTGSGTCCDARDLVEGCQAQVFLRIEISDTQTLRWHFHSDSRIIAGILQLMAEVFEGTSVALFQHMIEDFGSEGPWLKLLGANRRTALPHIKAHATSQVERAGDGRSF